jgi:hypothetical protein
MKREWFVIHHSEFRLPPPSPSAVVGSRVRQLHAAFAEGLLLVVDATEADVQGGGDLGGGFAGEEAAADFFGAGAAQPFDKLRVVELL